MNQIFQMKYYKTFNDNFQQSYRLSKLAMKESLGLLGHFQLKSLCSIEAQVHPRSLGTLKACYFAVLQSARLHSTSFKRSNSNLFRAKRPRSQQEFKDDLCPLKQPLLYFIKRQKNEFFCKALYLYISLECDSFIHGFSFWLMPYQRRF